MRSQIRSLAFRLLVGLGLLGGSAVNSFGSLLDGKTITTEFDFPAIGTIGFGGVPVNSIVGPGVEIFGSPQGFPITNIDFSDTSISHNTGNGLLFTGTGAGPIASSISFTNSSVYHNRLYNFIFDVSAGQNLTLSADTASFSNSAMRRLLFSISSS